MKHKAGLVPYYRKNGEVYMMFMVSSNADFGGSFPQIAKGNIDPGEEIAVAAVREAQEELGLNKNNMVLNTLALAWENTITGLIEDYRMSIFCVEVFDPNNFRQPGRETKNTVWMTASEFSTKGRSSHQNIVKAVEQLTKN